MIGTFLVFGAIAAVFMAMHFRLIQKYSKTKDKPSLYFGIASIFWAITADLGVLLVVADALGYLSLAILFYRILSTSGVLGFVFLNVFAVAMTKPNAKIHGVWILLIPLIVITSIVWAFDPIPGEVIGGTREFTLTSMYKAPYGLPLIETILASMAVMAIYPIYLFFHITMVTKDKIIKIKSLLMGIGIFIGTTAYAIEVTDAIPYYYMLVYRPMIFVGSFMAFFSYMMPKWLERKLVRSVLLSERSVKSFVEQFFVYPATPSIRTRPYAFSKTLGLNHRQMAGRKILLEFDPASHYEKAIQDFATEALANAEPVVVFTRRGSAIHSSLGGQKAVKFFCLTQQVSVPRKFSENEILLPSSDTSLMLDVLDKALKVSPQSVINVVFDSLSDLVLSIGFEKTHYFMRYAAEMLASPKVTALFLLNRAAHDPEVASSLRGLFSNQISFGKRGLESIKLPKAEAGTVEVEGISTKEGR
jgi:hypothetical protein